MMKFMAAVLSVIAVGVLGIAYGLLSPRVSMNGLHASQAYLLQDVPAAGSDQVVRQGNLVTMQPMPTQPMLTQAPQMRRVVPATTVNQPEVVYVPVSSTAADAEVVVRQPDARPVRTVYTPAASRDDETVTVERSPRRDWKRTAMIIGGTSAAGAGVGAIIGGKKGALIGAAIGGGASTIYQTTR